jgi:3-dehydroquinate synthase
MNEPQPTTQSQPADSALVPVRLGQRSYDIHIHAGKINGFSTELSQAISAEQIIVITDDTVAPLYLETALEQCRHIAARVDSIIVPAGESTKSVAQCDVLWQRLIELGTDRKTVIVALGGGVIGDLAGFIAASFTRGLDFIQIPTTLLAQVDSSVGGKVGINLPQAKNMVGAFWQPKTVIIDPLVLNTLDARNYAAGMAEVIKYGVIMDAALFEFIEQSVPAIKKRDPETLTKIIAWCCRCKADVVAEDETETTGRRAILNYGHTFGHAIESVFGYGKFLHGEAISIGMTCAARLAISLNLCDPQLLTRQTALFQSLDLPTECPAQRHDELLAAMKHDKKVAAGKLKLILPTKIGHVETIPAPADEVLLQSL